MPVWSGEEPRWSEPGLTVAEPWRRVPDWAAFLAFVAALWFLKDLGYLLADRPGGLSVLWPPAGVFLFALLVAPVPQWPAFAGAGFAVGIAGSLAHGRSPELAFLLNAGNAIEAILGAWLVRRITPRVTARTLRGVAALIVAPAAAKLLVVAGSRLPTLLRGGPVFDPRFGVYWLGSILGVATLGWLLVAWAEEAEPEERPATAVLETVLALGALGGAAIALQHAAWAFPREILLVPPVIWLAVRFGPRGGSVAVCLATLALVFTAWNGQGAAGAPDAELARSALSMQLFVAVFSAPIPFVSAVVAERRAAEARRALLARAMDQTVDGLGIYEEDGRILWANAAAARFYGAPVASIVGRRAWELLPDGTPEGWRRRWNRLLAEGVVVQEERTRLPDGRVTPWELSVALVREGGRKLAVAAIRDVSDRQRASEALRLAGIGTLAAGVAHEINNPLATVVGNLALVRERLAALRERGGDPALVAFADEWLEPIVDAEDGARRVREIVAELRVFARAEAMLGPVDVARAMRSALSLAQSEIQHRARLVTRIADVPPVFGSEGRLAQAFANVLVNAARAIPEGASQENEIRVDVRFRDGAVVAEVADTGVGMTREVRARIFEPFFTTREIGEGSGLGLAVTHAIVTSMNGRIDVDSAPGAGTRLRISFPPMKGLEHLAPPPAAPLPDEREAAVAPFPAPEAPPSGGSPPPPAPPGSGAPAAPAAAPASPVFAPPAPAPPAGAPAAGPPPASLPARAPEGPPAAAVPAPAEGPPQGAHPEAPGSAPEARPRLKLLVVDDEPLVARSLQRILSREHDVDVADRARAALDRIASGERFDVILCDLMMPDVNGMAFHDEVGILDPDLVERIVFVTGGAFTDAASAFLERVPNLRLEKPVDPTTLRETVRRFTPRPRR